MAGHEPGLGRGSDPHQVTAPPASAVAVAVSAVGASPRNTAASLACRLCHAQPRRQATLPLEHPLVFKTTGRPPTGPPDRQREISDLRGRNVRDSRFRRAEQADLNCGLWAGHPDQARSAREAGSGAGACLAGLDGLRRDSGSGGTGSAEAPLAWSFVSPTMTGMPMPSIGPARMQWRKSAPSGPGPASGPLAPCEPGRVLVADGGCYCVHGPGVPRWEGGATGSAA
jgi:hypothetical protein